MRAIFEPILRQSFTRPKEAVAALLALRLSAVVAWQLLVVAVLLGVVVSAVSDVLMPAPPQARGGGEAPIVIGPFAFAAMVAGALVLMVGALHISGRIFGGQGRLGDMVLAMAWLQAMLLVLQVAQLVLGLLAQPLWEMVLIASYVLTMWYMVAAVQVVHGFGSAARAVAAVVVGLFGLGFAVAVVMIALGIAPGGM